MPVRSSRRHAAVAGPLLALVVLVAPLAACQGQPATEGSTSSAAPSSESDDGREAAFAEAERLIRTAQARDLNERLSEDEEWATSEFRQDHNDFVTEVQKRNLTIRGTAEVTGVKEGTYEPNEPGGGYLTMVACVTSTQHPYDSKGRNVDASTDRYRVEDVFRYTLVTSDGGSSWSVQEATQAKGESCE